MRGRPDSLVFVEERGAAHLCRGRTTVHERQKEVASGLDEGRGAEQRKHSPFIAVASYNGAAR